MELSAAGIIAVSQIQNLSKFFADTEIWNYVVMPNHVHLVIAIGTSTHSNAITGNTTTDNATTDKATNNKATNDNATNDNATNDTTTNDPVGTLFKASAESPSSVSSTLGCLKSRQHDAPDYQDFHHNSKLSVIIRCLKGGVKRDSNRQGINFAWQPRFHEHIIRNQRSYDYIMNYINLNVINWVYDRFNPAPQESVPWKKHIKDGLDKIDRSDNAYEANNKDNADNADAFKSVPTNADTTNVDTTNADITNVDAINADMTNNDATNVDHEA